jgi:hypothetical protein
VPLWQTVVLPDVVLADVVDTEQLLAPPEPDQRLRLAGGVPVEGKGGHTSRLPAAAVAAHVPFQVISGM